jgi:hypothetical protein
MTPLPIGFNRRRFLRATGGLALASVCSPSSRADERPEVIDPRATSGDAVGPDWDQSLTITVGPDKADLVGSDQKVIQAAVDYVARLGGGTVKILPGTYRMRNAVYLQSHVRLLGSGMDSVLVKEPSQKVVLASDSDWFDQEITLADATGFEIGDGVCLRHDDGGRVTKRTLIARSGQRFKLDRALRANYWTKDNATAATLFPLLSGENIANVAIENLTLDGNGTNNEKLDGNHAGCIFLQDCNTIAIRGVTARNYNGDGISWQVCHDVVVESCHSHDHTGLGLHPGSGSQRPIIRGNKLQRNDIGIFFCWGVKFGLASKNIIEDNRSSGISIGHRDNNNLIIENEIRGSGKVGVLFRPERGKAFAPHRNRVERNRILDTGSENGVAIDVQGETESVALVQNELRETRQPLSRIGVRLGPQTREIQLIENVTEGFAVPISDLRQG